MKTVVCSSTLLIVIPAQAEIQVLSLLVNLDTRFRGYDGIGTFRHKESISKERPKGLSRNPISE
jgi:hypothetical protein